MRQVTDNQIKRLGQAIRGYEKRQRAAMRRIEYTESWLPGGLTKADKQAIREDLALIAADVKKLYTFKACLERGDLRNARRAIYRMDTAVEDVIPSAIYERIMEY